MNNETRILFSNIGYAKGIDGSLQQHITRFGRNFYCKIPIQEQTLSQLKTIIETEAPDLCCLVEVDKGSFQSAYFNQIEALIDKNYHFHDIADKYGENSVMGRMPMHKGRSNAFLAKKPLEFQRLYFTNGTKRLIYQITLDNNITVFFAHFSLEKSVRALQFKEIRLLIQKTEGNIILLADFNIMQGFGELKPLLDGTNLKILNDEDHPTFTFHRRKLALDLCLCSENLLPHIDLKIIPQNFSDHAALLVSLDMDIRNKIPAETLS